jgi:hypothetical protein
LISIIRFFPRRLVLVEFQPKINFPAANPEVGTRVRREGSGTDNVDQLSCSVRAIQVDFIDSADVGNPMIASFSGMLLSTRRLPFANQRPRVFE